MAALCQCPNVVAEVPRSSLNSSLLVQILYLPHNIRQYHRNKFTFGLMISLSSLIDYESHKQVFRVGGTPLYLAWRGMADCCREEASVWGAVVALI